MSVLLLLLAVNKFGRYCLQEKDLEVTAFAGLLNLFLLAIGKQEV